MDPYEVLGVSPLAKPAEVTAAYRVLAQIFHPDRYANSPVAVREAAARRMARLNEAYQAIRHGLVPSRDGGGGRSGPGRRPGSWAGSAAGSWASTASRRGPDADPRARQREARSQAARAAREHDAQARVSKDRRTAARQKVPKGEAREAAKDRIRRVAGMGQALHTNELSCRGCESLQRLPAGWQDRLDSASWYCSSCGRLLLSR